MGLLGPNNNERTADDVRVNLEEGDMSPEDAAVYGATLAQEAYRNGDMSRDEFQDYLDQAEEVALSGQGDVAIPEVDASVENLRTVHDVYSSQQEYQRAREWVSGHEGLEQADLLAVPGPQNVAVGAHMADELGLDYSVMVAQDESTQSLGPNADQDSVVPVTYGDSIYDVEPFGPHSDFDGKVTVIGGSTWGRNMTEADSFLDAPARNSDHVFGAVQDDGTITEMREKKSLTQTVRETLGF